MRRGWWLAVLALVLRRVACGGSDGSDGSPPGAAATWTLRASFGDVEGEVDPDTGGVAYLGIPYAAPPTSTLRFMPPQPLPSNAPGWEGVRRANQRFPSCVQWDDASGVDSGTSSEDCLTLDVYVPPRRVASEVDGPPDGGDGNLTRPDEPLPITVYLHGGSFYTGGASGYAFGRLAAATRMIVVVPQYRLWALGYLNLAGLDGDVTKGTSWAPNVGLLDQRMALRWVRDHAEDLGGDPSRVSLAGQSAGGAAVAAHLTAPDEVTGRETLFSAAVMQSPGLHNDVSADWPDDCQDGALDCLQSLPVADLVKAAAAAARDFGARFGPHTAPTGDRYGDVYDSMMLSACPLRRATDGDIRRVPVLVGSNGCEACDAVLRNAAEGDNPWPPPPVQPDLDAFEYIQALRRVFESSSSSVASKAALALERRRRRRGHRSPLSLRVLGDLGTPLSTLNASTVQRWYAPYEARAREALADGEGGAGAWGTLAMAASDAGAFCAAELFANALSRPGPDSADAAPRVYRYVFNRTTGPWAEAMPGASHGQEIAFLELAGSEGDLAAAAVGAEEAGREAGRGADAGERRAFPLGLAPSEEDVALSAAMAALWGDMAAWGEPRTGEAAGLEPYTEGKGDGSMGGRAAVLFHTPRLNATWEVPTDVAERCARWAPFLTD